MIIVKKQVNIFTCVFICLDSTKFFVETIKEKKIHLVFTNT